MRQILFGVFLLLSAWFSTMSLADNWSAGTWNDFTAADFKSAQAAGKTIVLDFYAKWCPTCRIQEPVLESIVADPKFKSVVGFKVAYDDHYSDDEEKAIKRRLKIPTQSTLVLFKGTKQISMQAGLVDKKQIEEFFSRGL